MLCGPAEMPTIGPLSGEPGCGGVMRLMYSCVGVIVSSSSASFLHTVALRTPKPSLLSPACSTQLSNGQAARWLSRGAVDTNPIAVVVSPVARVVNDEAAGGADDLQGHLDVRGRVLRAAGI